MAVAPHMNRARIPKPSVGCARTRSDVAVIVFIAYVVVFVLDREELQWTFGFTVRTCRFETRLQISRPQRLGAQRASSKAHRRQMWNSRLGTIHGSPTVGSPSRITSLAAGHTVRAVASAIDDRAALDLAVDKFERQLRKLKERLIQRTRTVEHKHLNHAPEISDEKVQDAPQIVRTKRFAMHPMTPEEAALQMEMIGHDFFFFLDAESGRHCVLYHRKDGQLGLIEPV